MRCIIALLGIVAGTPIRLDAGPATAPTGTRPAASQPALDARQVLDEFRAALKAGNAAKAREHVATFDRPNDPMLRDWLHRLAELKWAPAVLEIRQSEPAAVGVVQERPRDIDPVYLIKRDGRFLVMPGISRYRGGIAKLTAEEEAEFRLLEEWFKEQKASRQR